MRPAIAKLSFPSILLGICVASTIGVATGAANRPAAPAEPALPAPAPVAPVIAIVDVNKVMENLEERKEGRAEIEKRMTDLQALAKKAEQETAAEEQKIKVMAAGPARVAAIKAYRDKTFKSNIELEYAGRILAEDRASLLRDTYLRVDEAAARLAKKNGYQLVISSDEKLLIPQPPGAKFDEISQLIAIKRMLYVDPTLDISEELITLLNNEYQTGGAPAAAPKK